MQNNTLEDLNAHLFEQLKRLSNKDLKGEELKEEVFRSKAVSAIAKDIVSSGNLVLQATRLMDDRMDADLKLPKMLEVRK